MNRIRGKDLAALYGFALGACVLLLAGLTLYGQSIIPFLNSISPSTVVAGGPGFDLTVTGGNFTSAGTGTVVTWTPSGGATTDLVTTFVSTSQVKGAVPAALIATAGTVTINVRNPGGAVAASPATLTIIPPLTITSLSPSSAAAGSPSFTLTIDGTGFCNVDFPIASTAYWTVGSTSTALTTTIVNSTQITVPIDASMVATPGSATVNVVNPKGCFPDAPEGVSNGVVFPINAPAISSLVPSSAPAGTPGLTLTVNGSSFLAAITGVSPGSVVQWTMGATTTALATTFVTSGQLTAVVPAGLLTTPGTASVTVMNPGGSISNAASFVIGGPAISSINPSTVAAGSATFTLTVNGANFIPGSTVRFNGTALTTTFVNGGQLTATVTAALVTTAGTASITVMNPGGAVSNSATLTISAPSISSISPNAVSAGSPTFTLTVNGANFLPGSVVRLNGSALATTFGNAGVLTATVLASQVVTPGAASITVMNPGGAVSNSATLTINAPSISSLIPNTILRGSGDFVLTVIGANFVNGSTVLWNGSALPTNFVGSGILTATVSASLLTSARTITITVSNPGGATSNGLGFLITLPPLDILTSSLPKGIVGQPYSVTFVGTGGDPPYTWAAQTALPPGLNFSADGVLSGTPTEAGTFRFQIVLRDDAFNSIGKQFTLVVEYPSLLITTTSLPAGQVGAPYSASVAATGGKQPYTFSGAGAGGLSVSASGAVSGTPSTAGNFTITVTVTDAAGTQASKSFAFTILEALTIVTASPFPQGIVGNPYSTGVNAAGGRPPYTFSGTGAAGLSVSSSGIVSGTPSTAGDFTITVTVTDSAGNQASKAFAITILAPLTIPTTSPLPQGIAGVGYSASVTATGGRPPYTFSGTGAAGLSVGATGTVSGTPNVAGDFTITVSVTDSANNQASKSFAITILPALSIVTQSLPQGSVGAAYSASVAAAGGRPPYTFSGAGAAGLSVSAAGAISGTPNAPGSFTLTVTVTDAANNQASRSFTVVVGLPPAPPPNIGGVTDVAPPASQPRVTVEITDVYPLDITGQFTLTFAPDVIVGAANADDPAVQFSTSGRTVTFRIPTGTRQAVFPAPEVSVQTGTVAGTITLTIRMQAGGADITSTPAPVRTIRVNRAPPVITSVRAVRTATGFDLMINGYSTPREVTQATFRFSAAPGSNLQTTDATVAVTNVFTTWYQSAPSNAFGSQFTYTQPFTIQGNANAFSSVSVTLTNSVGTSQPATVNAP